MKTLSWATVNQYLTDKDLVKYETSWDLLIPLIIQLREKRYHSQAFNNQLKMVSYWLDALQIKYVFPYVIGAINVLNGKRGKYPV